MAEATATKGKTTSDSKPVVHRVAKPLEYTFPVVQENDVSSTFRPMPRSFRQERSAQVFAIRLCRILELSPNAITVVYSKFMKKFRVYADI